jgi:hypothetical protein
VGREYNPHAHSWYIFWNFVVLYYSVALPSFQFNMAKSSLSVLEEKLTPPLLKCPKCAGDLEGTIWPLGFEPENGDAGYQIMFICADCSGVWKNLADQAKDGTK